MDLYWQWVLYLWLALLCVRCEKIKDGMAGGTAGEYVNF